MAIKVETIEHEKASASGRGLAKLEPLPEDLGQRDAVRLENVNAAGVRLGSPRRGRPRLEDKARTIEALAPWKAAGMSRATWYRRRREC
jgi:hypothetical protein